MIEAYIQKGFYLLPVHHPLPDGGCSCGKEKCSSIGKHPRNQNGALGATNRALEIVQWRDDNTKNWGIATGTQLPDGRYLVVLDIDPRNGGDESLHNLEEEHEPLPATPCQLTGGGGQHYFFASREPVKSGVLADGVDVKGVGGFVIAAPSTHASGGSYQWDIAASFEDTPIADLPDWITLEVHTPTDKPKSTGSVSESLLAMAFKAAGWAGEELANNKLAVRCPWDDEHSNAGQWHPRCSETVILPPTEKSTMGQFHCMHSHCKDRTQSEVLAALPEDAKVAARNATKPKVVLLADYKKTAIIEEIDAPDALDLSTLVGHSNQSGWVVHATPDNAFQMCSRGLWADVVAMDTLRGCMTLMRPPPYPREWGNGKYPSQWTDSDDRATIQWFSSMCPHTKWPKEMILDMMRRAADQHQYNELTRYLDGLAWDGKGRLDNWLVEYAKASDTQFVRDAGKMWMISAVARAFEPGCQADYALTLVGDQGSGKSTMLKMLGSPWYIDDIGDISSKDGPERLRGSWIVEIGEMASLTRQEVATVRAFITRRDDKYRGAYERNTSTNKRTCVFAPTANEMGLFTDPTGNRRFWPVQVGKIDLQRIQDERDLLWAEAVVLYKSGMKWWPTTHGFGVGETERHMINDPWFEALDLSVDVVTTRQVYEAIGLEVKNRTKQQEHRIAGILQKAGYRPAGRGKWVRNG